MIVHFIWKEGRETRVSECHIPTASWETMVEHFRQAAKKAYKYSDEEIPSGLLKEGEQL